jgi:DNA polymerase-3 subunit alpha
MFNRLDQVIASAALVQKDRKSGQASLFDFDAPPPKPAAVERPKGSKKSQPEQVDEWPKSELIAFEKELLGFYVSGHPLDSYRGNFETNKLVKLGTIEEITERCIITVGGIVHTADVRYSKKDNRPFAILKLEDFTGMVEAMCWSDDYEKFKELIVVGNAVEIRATCDKDQRTEMNKLTVRDIKAMKPRKPAANRPQMPASTDLPDATPQILMLKLDAGKQTAGELEAIRDILSRHPGEVPVRIEIESRNGPPVVIEAGKEYCVDQTTDLVQALLRWM